MDTELCSVFKSKSFRLFECVFIAEVCGTPGYLAPEIIECSMDAGHQGYGTAVDM